MENGYEVRAFNGKVLHKDSLEGFAQFQWRPRPKSLLMASEEKHIVKNLRKLSKKFEEEDEMLLNAADAEVRIYENFMIH